MKPIGSAQGKGIFLFTRLNEISEWKNDFKTKGMHNGKDSDVEAYVVQRFVCMHSSIYPLMFLLYVVLYS